VDRRTAADGRPQQKDEGPPAFLDAAEPAQLTSIGRPSTVVPATDDGGAGHSIDSRCLWLLAGAWSPSPHQGHRNRAVPA